MTGFLMDDFADRHLRHWFDAGLAPNDWDLGDLLAFEAWCKANAEDLPEYASWSNLAQQFERSNA
jgi:hypothetical protein